MPLPIPDTFSLEYVPPIKESTEMSDVESHEESVDWHKECKNVASKDFDQLSDTNQTPMSTATVSRATWHFEQQSYQE